MLKETNAGAVADTAPLPADVVSEIVGSIRLALGHAPALLGEKDIERLGLRSSASLRRDRCVGGNTIPFVRGEHGRVFYKIADIIRIMAAMQVNSDMPEARRAALVANLEKAHNRKRQANNHAA